MMIAGSHMRFLAAGALVLLGACEELFKEERGEAPQPPSVQLEGDYVVVSLRRASDVAGGPDDPDFTPALIGRTVSFADQLAWLTGATCERWSAVRREEPVVNLDDPMLADALIGPETGLLDPEERRKIAHLDIRCGETVLGVLARIDRRVLVVPSPSGLVYAILERPLPADRLKALQRQLASMKFYHGEESGEMDAATRRALSFYAAYRGRYDVTFERSAVTENLLNGLIDQPAFEAGAPAPTVEERFPDYRPKLSADTVFDYRPGLALRLTALPPVSRETFQEAYVALGELMRDALRHPGRMEQGNVALGADPEQYVPSDEELLAAELGDRLAALVRDMTAEEIMDAWHGAAVIPPSVTYKRFDYRHVDVMGSGRFFYASPPQTAVIEIPPRPEKG